MFDANELQELIESRMTSKDQFKYPLPISTKKILQKPLVLARAIEKIILNLLIFLHELII
jgi:hypothetical protein